MSETLIAYIVDGKTGEIVERKLTDEEIADLESARIESQTRQIEQEAKAKARASALAKLKKLGLTDKEIAAL